MTTYIHIENATIVNFTLYDVDNNNFGPVYAEQRYSLKLNYSDTFKKQYNLVFSGGYISFWLNINGELGEINLNNTKFCMLIQGTSTRCANLPPYNKIIITPQNNTLARAPLRFTFPVVPDIVLRNDFRPW